MDRSCAIAPAHLLAALALVDYCEKSVRHVFGEATGDDVADAILGQLRQSKDGLTMTDIHAHFSRNVRAERIAKALGLLLNYRLARREQEQTGGRPRERWFATGK
jgi:hypothetical protein